MQKSDLTLHVENQHMTVMQLVIKKSLAFQLRTETDMRLENCWTVRLYIDVSWWSNGATLFHSAVCLLPGC
jgi:hypothetical protein